MLCFKVLAILDSVRFAKNSSISLAFSNEANWGTDRTEHEKKKKDKQ